MFAECCCAGKAETTITAIVAGEEDDASKSGEVVKEVQAPIDPVDVVKEVQAPIDPVPVSPAPDEPAEATPEDPVAAKPVAEEPAKSVALSLGMPDGSQKQIQVSRRPMGLEYKVPPASSPFTIVAVEGQAAELGVEVGWTVLTIGDVEMRAAEDVSAAAALLASLPVQMWLQQPGSGDKTVLISRQPLGMEFKRKAPFDVTIVTAGSLAEELGISVGMAVSQVGGTLLRSEGDADKAIAEIAGLPTA